MQLPNQYHISLMIMESLQSLVAIVSLLLLILLPNFQFTTSNKTASFSLKLIHRDSPESPSYPGAMTFQERVERLVKSSESRASYWKTITMAQPNMMRAAAGNQGYEYQVEVEIGDPRKTYYLVLDTGSGLTWLQSQPCKECFPQKNDIYDPLKSKTFREVRCNYPLCRHFFCADRQYCSYIVHYLDKSYTQGYAALESFHFKDQHGTYTHIFDVLFGCSYLNRGFNNSKKPKMAGIIGLDQSPYSFITLLGDFIMRRFSYCLINPFTPGISKVSYLKFGLDMGYLGGPVKTTPFVKIPNSYYYGLNLLDISVNHKRLNYAPDTFKFRSVGSGGFVIDSGCAISYIDVNAYDRLEDELVEYFSAFKQLTRAPNSYCPGAVRICYHAPKGFRWFPTLTLHFEGADLIIEPENVGMAVHDLEFFFVAIAPGDISILGAFQQYNTRFTYDLHSNILAFNREDCSKDAA